VEQEVAFYRFWIWEGNGQYINNRKRVERERE
jgi:hypothetical protein